MTPLPERCQLDGDGQLSFRILERQAAGADPYAAQLSVLLQPFLTQLPARVQPLTGWDLPRGEAFEAALARQCAGSDFCFLAWQEERPLALGIGLALGTGCLRIHFLARTASAAPLFRLGRQFCRAALCRYQALVALVPAPFLAVRRLCSQLGFQKGFSLPRSAWLAHYGRHVDQLLYLLPGRKESLCRPYARKMEIL